MSMQFASRTRLCSVQSALLRHFHLLFVFVEPYVLFRGLRDVNKTHSHGRWNVDTIRWGHLYIPP